MKEKSEIPGPASYDPQKLSSQITVTLKKRVSGLKNTNMQVPGPGYYDTSRTGFFVAHENKKKMKGPSYNKPHQDIFSFDTQTPGPQDYDVNLSQVDPSVNPLGTLFAREKRNMRWQQGDPDIDTGPGIYDLKSTIPYLPIYEQPGYKDKGIIGLLS